MTEIIALIVLSVSLITVAFVPLPRRLRNLMCRCKKQDDRNIKSLRKMV